MFCVGQRRLDPTHDNELVFDLSKTIMNDLEHNNYSSSVHRTSIRPRNFPTTSLGFPGVERGNFLDSRPDSPPLGVRESPARREQSEVFSPVRSPIWGRKLASELAIGGIHPGSRSRPLPPLSRESPSTCVSTPG